MSARGHETALVQQENSIGIFDRREAVGNHKQGLISNKAGSD